MLGNLKLGAGLHIAHQEVILVVFQNLIMMYPIAVINGEKTLVIASMD